MKLEKKLIENKSITDEDESGDPKYYGYTSRNSSWVIIEHNTTAGTYRYAVGHNGYTTAFSGRAGLTYTIPENL